MTAYITLLIGIIGAILYITVHRADLKQIALVYGACGFLAFMFAIAGKSVELLK